MSYSIEASTDGCYEGTTCLINKLDIWDEFLIDFSKYDADRFMVSTIHAAQGVYDDLIEIFRELIRETPCAPM